MTEPNVFSALSRYTSAEENTLTESFVFLVRLLLTREPGRATQFLNQLCSDLPATAFANADAISLVTQGPVGNGWIDIEIRALDTRVYIEVKHDSPLSEGQLEYYLAHLQTETETNKRLILLTRSRASENETRLMANRDFRYVRWGEVHSWLHQAYFDDEVCAYFAQNFNLFLQEKRMSMEKIAWDYIDGVPAMNNLVKMLETAIPEAKPKTGFKRSAGWSWRGFYINPDIFCGVRYDYPLIISFENNQPGGTPTIKRDLDLDKTHFFAMTGDEQFQTIVDFLKSAFAEMPTSTAAEQ